MERGEKRRFGVGVDCQLPDGAQIQLGRETHEAPELLYTPSKGNLDVDGIHRQIQQSLNNVDQDLQKTMRKNIVVCGGSSQLRNFD